jgi:predicted amino acid racemase
MNGHPTLTVDLDAVAKNPRRLGARLRGDGFTLVGVTKCFHGEPRVGQALLEAGCAGLGDAVSIAVDYDPAVRAVPSPSVTKESITGKQSDTPGGDS